MQQATSAYAKVAQAAQPPRELEAMVLMKSAARLQAIRDAWEGRSADLGEALTYNRKLWTILVTSATGEENPLPPAVKQNVASLGMFVFTHTITLMGAPSPDRLGILIDINRELAAGLRGNGSASAAA
jgi:flagellar protein FlaF